MPGMHPGKTPYQPPFLAALSRFATYLKDSGNKSDQITNQQFR